MTPGKCLKLFHGAFVHIQPVPMQIFCKHGIKGCLIVHTLCHFPVIIFFRQGILAELCDIALSLSKGFFINLPAEIISAAAFKCKCTENIIRYIQNPAHTGALFPVLLYKIRNTVFYIHYSSILPASAARGNLRIPNTTSSIRRRLFAISVAKANPQIPPCMVNTMARGR